MEGPIGISRGGARRVRRRGALQRRRLAGRPAVFGRFVDSGGNLLVFTGDLVKPESGRGSKRPGCCRGGLRGRQRTVFMASRRGRRITQYSLRLATRCTETCDRFSFGGSRGLCPSRPRAVSRRHKGAPLLVERTHGAGRSLLFAFPADNAWGEWAIQRLDVPLVHQLVGYLTDRLPETGPVSFALTGDGPGQAAGVAFENGKALVRNVDPTESEISGRRWRTFASFIGCRRRSRRNRGG